MRYIKLQHRVVHARYDEPTGKWHLRIRRPRNPGTRPKTSLPPPNVRGQPAPEGEAEELYEEFEDTADLLFTGVGSLSRWKWPEIDGLKDFKGKLFHTADFELGDESKPWQEAVHEWKDKRVGVIGVVSDIPSRASRWFFLLSGVVQGSSAIQIVPALQPRVKKIINFVRGKTWISTPFSGAKMAELMKRDPDAENCRSAHTLSDGVTLTAPIDVFSEEDKERFKDPEYYKQFRHELESDLNVGSSVLIAKGYALMRWF